MSDFIDCDSFLQGAAFSNKFGKKVQILKKVKIRHNRPSGDLLFFRISNEQFVLVSINTAVNNLCLISCFMVRYRTDFIMFQVLARLADVILQ